MNQPILRIVRRERQRECTITLLLTLCKLPQHPDTAQSAAPTDLCYWFFLIYIFVLGFSRIHHWRVLERERERERENIGREEMGWRGILGFEYGIVQGPLGPDISSPELVAAVANAGGLGFLRAPDWVFLFFPFPFSLLTYVSIDRYIITSLIICEILISLV